jgi:hypothetical protein
VSQNKELHYHGNKDPERTIHFELKSGLKLAVVQVSLILRNEGPDCVQNFDFHRFGLSVKVVRIRSEVKYVPLEKRLFSI